MIHFNNIFKKAAKQALVLGALGLGFASCTKNFEQYNTDKTGITNGNLNIPSLYGGLETAIWSNYQRAQNLSADGYSGYMMSSIAFGGNINNLNYAMNDGWNSTGFNDQYTMIMGPIVNVIKPRIDTAQPDLWAVALIIKVEAMHRVTDKYGSIPYSQVGTSLTKTAYDTQDSVYRQFFSELDVATGNLNSYIAANGTKTQLAGYDVIYNGDYTKWLKFANSLRLRLAMHIAKASPVLAQAQVQKALSAPGGLMTVPGDDAAVAQSGGRENDLYQIAHDWSNTNLGAAIGTYLTGYKDPRITAYALPATDNAVKGLYTGIRLGISIPGNDGTIYQKYAFLNTATSFTFSAPQQLMTAAEVWFLRAEAALRGWSSENAQTDYETGIQTSMTQWGVEIGTYLSDATSTQAAYTDPKNNANNAAALSTITIKWNNNATNEQKLERIITQKWLAMFPEGQEAWTEYRRTGYPRLFPVVINNSNGTINTATQIRRIPYPSGEYTSNGNAVAAAVSSLGGPDTGGTPLWWDTNKGQATPVNF